MTADAAPGQGRGPRVAAAPERLRVQVARATIGEAPGSAAVPAPRPALTILLEGEDGARGAGVAAPLGRDASAELDAAEGVLRSAAALLGETCPGPEAGAPAGTTADVLDEVAAQDARRAVWPRNNEVTAHGATRAAELRDDARETPSSSRLVALRCVLAPVAGLLRASAVARFALETAAARLLASRSGVTMADVLRGAPAHGAVGVNALVSAADRDLVAVARRLAAAGFLALKIKVGRGAWPDELVALRALRAALPAPYELRLDANGAWTPIEARARLGALAELEVAFVEQPVAAERLLELGACATPWAADESLAVPGMAEALLDDRSCAVFVLKPARLGLLDSLELARRAATRGKGVVVTHFFDGPSALGAACDLALALETPPLACGLMPWDAGTRAVPHLQRDGVCIPAAPAGGGDADLARGGVARP